MHDERRAHPRYRVAYDLRGTKLKPAAPAGIALPLTTPVIHGEVPNIGVGGLCLLTNDIAEVTEPLRCEIRTPDMPVGIPTLLQVRWVHKLSLHELLSLDEGRTYLLGLQFLL